MLVGGFFLYQTRAPIPERTLSPDGTTLFTHDYQQHLANIELAKHNGVLDSVR